MIFGRGVGQRLFLDTRDPARAESSAHPFIRFQGSLRERKAGVDVRVILMAPSITGGVF